MQYNALVITVAVLLCLVSESESGVVSGGRGGVLDWSGYTVCRIQAHDDEQVDRALYLASAHNAKEWVEVNRAKRYVDIMIHPGEKESFTRSLREAHLDMSIMIADVQDLIKRHAPLQKRSASGTFDYLKFNTFENIKEELHRIANDHNNIAKIEDIGQTQEGRKITILRVTDNIGEESTKPIVLIDAGIHAREWVSVSTILYIINQILENPDNKALLKSYDFVFMPVLNPDGYVYTWEANRLWRKNRANNSNSDCVGIDLNRNWNFHWGEKGTSEEPCDIDYRGYKPFSELETMAVKEWVDEYSNAIVLYINFHAYGQLWMTPYGYSTDTPSNENEMLRYCEIAVDAIKNVRGTTYDCGPVYTTIYPASSISVDWIRGAENIEFAYTVELPDKGKHGFLTPEDEIGPIGHETWVGIIQLLSSLGNDKNLLQTTEIIVD